jgi:hypothetical protein
MANGSFNTQDVANAVSDVVSGVQAVNTAGNLAGISMPGVFGTLAGPVGYGIKAVTDIYSASPTKPGFFGRLWDRQLMPFRRLGILSTPEADVAYGGYGTEEAEQEGVAGIDTGAGGYAREVTGPVDVTGLTLGGSEFGMGNGSGDVDPNTEIDTTPGPAAQHGGDESVSVDATEAETEEDYEDYDDDVFADGGYVQKYADGDLVEQTLMGFPLGGPASSGKKVPSLDNSTTSELLMLQAAIKRLGAPYKPKLHMRAEPGFDYDKANTALVLQAPESGLPAFHAFASGGRPPEGSFAKGTPQSFDDAGYGVSQPLGRGSVSFERKTSRADEKGKRIPALQSDRISLNNPFGIPLSAFYQEGEQPGGVESTSRGGSFAVGPLTLSGSKDKFSQGKNRTNVSNVEANVRTPISKRGILRAGAGRHQVEALNNQIRQMQRRTDKFNLGYTGRGDGSTYGATGTMEQVKGGPRTRSVQGFYNMQNPLGLGGNLNVSGSYVDPEIGRNALNAMLRWKKKF